MVESTPTESDKAFRLYADMIAQEADGEPARPNTGKPGKPAPPVTVADTEEKVQPQIGKIEKPRPPIEITDQEIRALTTIHGEPRIPRTKFTRNHQPASIADIQTEITASAVSSRRRQRKKEWRRQNKLFMR